MNSIPFVTAGLSSIFIQIEQRTLVAAGVIFRAVDPVFDMFHPPVDAKEIRSLHVFLLIQEGIGKAISQQEQTKFQDDCLVAKVQKLESAVRDLSEDDGETKFTVNELAIILDMDVEEIQDILRLTGDN